MADSETEVLDQKIRGEAYAHNVRLLAPGAPAELVAAARKALRDTNRLETLAVQVYRAQWSRELTEVNRQLIAAMDNELVHQSDSLSMLMQLGGRPTPLRAAFYVAGWCLGRASRMLGLRAMMRLGMWVEGKAIEHYKHLSAAVEWHKPTYQRLLVIWDDERTHRARWQWFLDHPEAALAPAESPQDDSESPAPME